MARRETFLFDVKKEYIFKANGQEYSALSNFDKPERYKEGLCVFDILEGTIGNGLLFIRQEVVDTVNAMIDWLMDTEEEEGEV